MTAAPAAAGQRTIRLCDRFTGDAIWEGTLPSYVAVTVEAGVLRLVDERDGWLIWEGHVRPIAEGERET